MTTKAGDVRPGLRVITQTGAVFTRIPDATVRTQPSERLPVDDHVATYCNADGREVWLEADEPVTLVD